MSNVDFRSFSADFFHAICGGVSYRLYARGDRLFRSIESLMLAEFAADAAVLWVALRAKHMIRPFRLFTAAAVGAAVTAFASMFLHTKAAYLVSAAAATPVMLIICTGGIRFSELLQDTHQL